MGSKTGKIEMGQVVTGIERLARVVVPELRGLRVGLLTNPCGVDRQLTSSIDIVNSLPYLSLTALYGPEHGIRGEVQAGDHVSTETDPITGIPIHSLYGETRIPTAEMLAGIDALLVDLQDVGVRYATYLSSVDNVLAACHENGKLAVILDRPNPLGGSVIAGGILDVGYRSFIGSHTVPVLHGMTLGELALMIAADRGYRAPHIVPMEGWERSMLWDATGLPWIFPSPNLPTLDTHLAYPATCLIEGTNLSEGRGLTRPFEVFGAPWIDPWNLAETITGFDIQGVAARPLYFTPMFSKHEKSRCAGVQLYVDETTLPRSVELGARILDHLASHYPDEFRWLEPPKEGSRYFIDLLSGDRRLRDTIDAGNGIDDLLAAWQEESAAFAGRRAPYLLYDSGR